MEGNGSLGRRLSTLFGKTPAEKAAVLVFQLPGEKARGKLVGLGVDAMPALLAALIGTAGETAGGGNAEARNLMRGAAAEVIVRIGVPALASLRPLIVSEDINEKKLGYSLARKILAGTLERADGGEEERKAAGIEVLGMLGSAHGGEIRLGVDFAADVPGDGTVRILGTLAKDGWSAAQRDACNARIAEISEIRCLLASGADIGRRTSKGAVSEDDLVRLLVPGDNVEAAETLEKEYRVADAMERSSTRAEAVRALGKIGTAEAVKALLGLLDGLAYEPGVLCSCSHDVLIARALRGAVARDSGLMPLVAEAVKKWNAAEREEIANVGRVSDSLGRMKAAHISELLFGVL
ncbi:MAG: hypothetical protein PHQ80_02425 [Candidatus ainarchaeum sp.]|nr:hypothetical protein [Candidatus ainarchaeum sp.]